MNATAAPFSQVVEILLVEDNEGDIRLTREALKEGRIRNRLNVVPVVVLTSSRADEDLLKAYDSHANCYISKPVGFEDFMQVIRSIENFWLTIVVLPPKD